MDKRIKNYKISGNYEPVDMGDELLLIPCNEQRTDSKVLVLNQMSSVIWRYLFCEKKSLDECNKTILAMYNVEDKVLRKDIDDFLELLINFKVIVMQE